MRLLNSFILVLLLATGAGATTYYVDNTGGSDGNNGLSTGAAWEHIHKACTASVISAGDIVLIRSGTYDSVSEGNRSFSTGSWYYLMSPKSGSSGSPITYKGYPGETRPRIHGDTTDAMLFNPVTLSGKSWVVLDSLELTHGHSAGALLLGTTDVVIKNCLIDSIGFQQDHGNNPGGITSGHHISNIYRVTIENNDFFDIYEQGIHLYDTDSCVITGNSIHDVARGVFLKSGGVGDDCDGCASGWGWDHNIHISYNDFYRTSGSRYGTHAFVTMSGWATEIYFHHNRIWGPFSSWPIYINECSELNAGWKKDHFWIYNNTIDVGGSAYPAILIKTVRNLNSTNYFDSAYFINNLIYGPPTSGTYYGAVQNVGSADAGCVNYTDTVYGGVLWDYNLIRDTTAGTGDHYWWATPTSSPWTISEFRAATPHADNDTIIDTGDLAKSNTDIFIDRASRDYRILSTSPAAGIGVDATIDGVTMPSYVGAYAPTDTTCPTVTLVLPTAGDTVEATQVDIEVNFTTDGAGDDIIITLYGEYSDATPDVLLFTDTLTADSTGWTYNWSSLLEDSTYYWRVIVTDTSCADTSAIRSFLVDSIPPAVVTPATIRGGYFKGVKIGEIDDRESRPEQIDLGRPSVYSCLPVHRRAD